ncbi:protein translocase subunit SecD [Granulosicoccaceae sp. 1_MG-2023]|nr:protein translocase subunit SecD [Granulosicoccaceae sp. 1_MG-2023]
MNKYPLWKYLLLGFVALVAIVYALPNVYGDDPAVQLAARSGVLEASLADDVASTLQAAGIGDFDSYVDGNNLIVRFADTEDQLAAQDALDKAFSDRYTLALNLVPATPHWLRAIAQPMYLGLDLRGGVHFLMEVDMQTAIAQTMERYQPDWRSTLRDEGLRYQGVQLKDGVLKARFSDAQTRDKALGVLRAAYQDLAYDTGEEGGYFFVDGQMTEQAILDEKKAALQQNIITLRNRVNELGVAEPVIQQQGAERIVVQLPGVQDTSRAKEILGATATLEYRLTYGTASDWYAAEETGRIPPSARLYHQRDDGSPILLQRQVIVTGDQIKDASSGIDSQSGSPAVFVNLDGQGAKRMQDVTSENVGNLMAVVFIENRIENREVNGEVIKERIRTEEVINVATIRDVLSHRFQTTGLDITEANNLSLLLRAGALKAPVEIVEERTIGPSLGADNISKGFNSVAIGLVLVLIFMVVRYKRFGLIADAALIFNLILIVAVLSSLQATLTLPGIAGMVLTVGMAVDANVLIFERIREELRSGASIQSSIHAGYDKAAATIADANITTLIAAVILFGMGTGPIKGFAVTLSIGILSSMFTAIMGTRALVNYFYGGKRLQKLPI